MIVTETKAGGVKYTAESKLDEFVLETVKASLRRCYTSYRKLWVAKDEAAKAASIIEKLGE
mgnify:FL=1